MAQKLNTPKRDTNDWLNVAKEKIKNAEERKAIERIKKLDQFIVKSVAATLFEFKLKKYEGSITCFDLSSAEVIEKLNNERGGLKLDEWKGPTINKGMKLDEYLSQSMEQYEYDLFLDPIFWEFALHKIWNYSEVVASAKYAKIFEHSSGIQPLNTLRKCLSACCLLDILKKKKLSKQIFINNINLQNIINEQFGTKLDIEKWKKREDDTKVYVRCCTMIQKEAMKEGKAFTKLHKLEKIERRKEKKKRAEAEKKRNEKTPSKPAPNQITEQTQQLKEKEAENKQSQHKNDEFIASEQSREFIADQLMKQVKNEQEEKKKLAANLRDLQTEYEAYKVKSAQMKQELESEYNAKLGSKQKLFDDNVNKLLEQNEQLKEEIAGANEQISEKHESEINIITQKKELEKECNTKRERIETLENELSSINDKTLLEMQAHVQKNEELQTRYNTITEECELLRQKEVSWNKERDELQNKMKDINDKYDQLRQKEEIWNKERDELQNKLKDMNDNYDQLRQKEELWDKEREESQNKMKGANDERNGLVIKLKEYETKHGQFADDIERLTKEKEAANANVATLKETMSGVSDRYIALEAQYNETKANMDAVNELNTKNEDEINRLQQELNETKQSESSKQTKLKQLVEDHASAVEKHQILQMEYNQMKEQNTKNQEEIKRLQQESERLKHEFDTAQIQRNEIPKRYETLSNEYEAMKSDLEQTNNDKIKAEKKINEMEASHKESSAKLSTITQEKDNIDTQYKLLLTQHQSIKEQNESFLAQIESLRTDISISDLCLNRTKNVFEQTVSDSSAKLRANRKAMDKLSEEMIALKETNDVLRNKMQNMLDTKQSLKEQLESQKTISSKREQTLNAISASLAECTFVKSNDSMSIIEKVNKLAGNYEHITIKNTEQNKKILDLHTKTVRFKESIQGLKDDMASIAMDFQQQLKSSTQRLAELRKNQTIQKQKYVQKIETLSKEKQDIVTQYERYKIDAEQTQSQLTKQLEQIKIENEQSQHKNDEFVASEQSNSFLLNQLMKQVKSEQEEKKKLATDYKDIEQHFHDLQTEYEAYKVQSARMKEELESEYNGRIAPKPTLFDENLNPNEQLKAEIAGANKQIYKSQINIITQEKDEWLKKYNDLYKIHQETSRNGELSVITQECEQLRQNEVSWNKERDELRTKYSTLTDECERLRQKEVSWNKEKDELQNKMKDINDEHNGLVIKLEEYETKQGQFTEDIERLTKEKETAAAKVAKLTETISGANDRYNALEAQYNETKANMDAVNANNYFNGNEIKPLQQNNERGESQNKMNDICGKYDQLRQKEEIWNKERDELQNKMKDINDERNGLVIKLKEYETKQGELTEDIERLTKEKEAASAKVAKLTETISGANALEAQYNETKANMDAVNELNANNEDEIKRLQQELNEAKQSESSKQTKLKQLVEDHASAVEKNQILQMEYNQMKEQNTKYKENTARIQQKIEAMDKQHTEDIDRIQHKYKAYITKQRKEANAASNKLTQNMQTLEALQDIEQKLHQKHERLTNEYESAAIMATSSGFDPAQIQRNEISEEKTKKVEEEELKQSESKAKVILQKQKAELNEAHEFIKELIQEMLEEKDKQMSIAQSILNNNDSAIRYVYDAAITPTGDLVAAIIDDKGKSNDTANNSMLIIALLFGFVASILMEYFAQNM